jgi:hypothetical protein
VPPEWNLINEFSQQHFDRLPSVNVDLEGVELECGEYYGYNYDWDKVTAKKGKQLPTTDKMKAIQEGRLEDQF